MSYMSFEYRFLLVYLGARFKFNNPELLCISRKKKKKKKTRYSSDQAAALQSDDHQQSPIVYMYVSVKGKTCSGCIFSHSEARCSL